MGYVEKIMGDSERALYRTHRHVIVLLRKASPWFLAFAVLLGLGITVLVAKDVDGEWVRFWIGVAVLCTVVVPLFLILRARRRGLQGGEFFAEIWRTVLAGIVLLAVGLVLMIWPLTAAVGWVGVAASLYPFYQWMRALLYWLNERYIITNRRVMEVGGIINKHVRDSALEKVNDVDLNQSFIGRIVRYGTVQIITGSDIGLNTFEMISNPVRFKKAMLNAKEQMQTSPSMVFDGGTAAAGPADAAPAVEEAEGATESVPDLIERYSQLRDKGILSEDEFQKKKRELLKHS